MQASDTWRYQLLPMLALLREQTIQKMIRTENPITIQFLRGELHAYDDLMTRPDRELARERQAKADAEDLRVLQEELDARRRPTGPAWARRWANRIRPAGRSGQPGGP
jgi:hypothetical protein